MVESVRSNPLALRPCSRLSSVARLRAGTSRPSTGFSDAYPWHVGHGLRPSPNLKRLPFSPMATNNSC